VKIGLLGASVDTGNMGVSVLAAGSVQNLLRQYPNADVYFLNYARQAEELEFRGADRKTQHRLVPIRFSKYLFQANNVFLLTAFSAVLRLFLKQPARSGLARRNAVLGEMSDTDVFVAISGGDSFSDIYGLVRLLYVGLPQILVLLLGKRLVLLPQTVGPFETPAARFVAKYILRGAETVYSRDAERLDAIREMAELRGEQRKKIRFSYDLGFQVPPARTPNLEISQLPPGAVNLSGLVGINISGLLWNEGRKFNLSVDYRLFTIRSIEYFLETTSSPILLVPHVASPGNADDDLGATQEVIAHFAKTHPQRVGTARVGLLYDETKGLIGQCDYFMGARMHACIAALSQAVPCSALAYSGKFEGVMASVGANTITIDLRNTDMEAALQAVIANYQNRHKLRENLRRTMPEVVKAVARI